MLISKIYDVALQLFSIFNCKYPCSTGLIRDDVLDNITLFWLTNTGISAARIYKLKKGGHFAAWEQPQLFSEEVRADLRPLRS
jgi:hypothetical protein